MTVQQLSEEEVLRLEEIDRLTWRYYKREPRQWRAWSHAEIQTRDAFHFMTLLVFLFIYLMVYLFNNYSGLNKEL